MAPLKVHRWGSPRSSAWLCLHGFMGTGFDWDVFARAALNLDPNLLIIAPDLPGHGESPPVSAGPLETQIASLLKTEKLDEVTLIGYSLGGRLGLQCVLSDPQMFPVFVRFPLLLALIFQVSARYENVGFRVSESITRNHLGVHFSRVSESVVGSSCIPVFCKKLGFEEFLYRNEDKTKSPRHG